MINIKQKTAKVKPENKSILTNLFLVKDENIIGTIKISLVANKVPNLPPTVLKVPEKININEARKYIFNIILNLFFSSFNFG